MKYGICPCTTCWNLVKEKDRARYTCKHVPGVTRLGRLDFEPIVKNCGGYTPRNIKKK